MNISKTSNSLDQEVPAASPQPEHSPLPLVSIGLPVFNESEYIEQSLKSLLGQDYTEIEIVISDNGSNDDTFEIIKRISANDKRIRIHEFNDNQGAMVNVQYVMKNTTGKYFMLASAHDLWSKNLITECVDLLEAQPDAVIAFGSPEWVDEKGQAMVRPVGWADTRGLDMVGKFMSVLWGSMNPILGVIRRESLPVIDEIYLGVGADLVILLSLILKGDFTHAPKAMFFRRQPRDIESYSQKLARYKSHDVRIIHSSLSSSFPLLRLPYEIVKTVFKSKQKWGIKIAIMIILIPAFPIRYIMGRKSQ